MIVVRTKETNKQSFLVVRGWSGAADCMLEICIYLLVISEKKETKRIEFSSEVLNRCRCPLKYESANKN